MKKKRPDCSVHIKIAERALGHALPKGAHVHHVDGNPFNNANSNLVICQDHQYHQLLHVRTRVVQRGGNPNTQRWCGACEQLLPIEQMATRKSPTPRICSYCIRCDRSRGLAYYHANRDRCNERCKRYHRYRRVAS